VVVLETVVEETVEVEEVLVLVAEVVVLLRVEVVLVVVVLRVCVEVVVVALVVVAVLLLVVVVVVVVAVVVLIVVVVVVVVVLVEVGRKGLATRVQKPPNTGMHRQPSSAERMMIGGVHALSLKVLDVKACRRLYSATTCSFISDPRPRRAFLHLGAGKSPMP